MKNFLIINFKRHGDNFYAANLIPYLEEQNYRIYYLAFEEFKSSIDIIENIKSKTLVSRKKLIQLQKNKLYPKVFALKYLIDSLEQLSEVEFDGILNYSNDYLSIAVSHYLKNKSTKIHGQFITKDHDILPSNQWAVVLNELSNKDAPGIIPHYSIYKKILEINEDTHINKTVNIKRVDKFDSEVKSHLNSLRMRSAKSSSPLKIIGIQLKTSEEKKDINFKTLIELTDLILDSDNYYPLFILAPTEEERNKMNKLNLHFDDKLVSVEADFFALPSVLSHIDLFVGPDSSIKHLVTHLNTGLIEISTFNSPFTKFCSNKNKSFILRENIDQSLTAVDILNAIHIYFNNHIIKNTDFSEGVSFLQIREFNGIQTNTPLAGNFNIESFLKEEVSKIYLGKLLDQQNQKERIKLVQVLENESLGFFENEKSNCSEVLKIILRTIKDLYRASKSRDSAIKFINSIDELLSFSTSSSLVAVPLAFFKSNLDLIKSNDINSNLDTFEKLLYQLKKNIQDLLSTYKTIQDGSSVKDTKLPEVYL